MLGGECMPVASQRAFSSAYAVMTSSGTGIVLGRKVSSRACTSVLRVEGQLIILAIPYQPGDACVQVLERT